MNYNVYSRVLRQCEVSDWCHHVAGFAMQVVCELMEHNHHPLSAQHVIVNIGVDINRPTLVIGESKDC